MLKQDIDKAAAALTGAIGYFKPMVVALNQADEVFSVLSNAVKLKSSIETEVEVLKETLADVKLQLEEGKAAIIDNKEVARNAKEMAEKDIAEAKAYAIAEVKQIKESVSERTKKFIIDSDARLAAANLALENSTKNHGVAMAKMAEEEATLKASIVELESKLTKLKEQAQKFAASLGA